MQLSDVYFLGMRTVFVALASSRTFDYRRKSGHSGKSRGKLFAPLYCFHLGLGGLWDLVVWEILHVARGVFKCIYLLRHEGLKVVILVGSQLHLLLSIACGLEVVLVKELGYVHIFAA